MANCVQCGNVLNAHSSICPSCGRQQKPRTTAGRKDVPPPEAEPAETDPAPEAIELDVDDAREMVPADSITDLQRTALADAAKARRRGR
jgi:hypothetical protein